MRAVATLLVLLLVTPALAAPSPDPIPVERHQLAHLDQYVHEMEQRWRALDRDCDPAAPFALMYLLTTREVRAHIAANHFDDNPFLVEWTMDFADYYLEAMDDRAAGRQASPAWQEAFDWAATGMSTVGDDVLLGMNAHINYDLALTTYAMGLPRDGRKADFDRINDALRAVAPAVNQGLAEHYDPSYADSDGDDPSGDALFVLIETWRELAWQNAVRLEQAVTPLEREAILAEMTAHSVTVAKSVQVPREDQTEARVAYCEAS